jgi:hypothetical protein
MLTQGRNRSQFVADQLIFRIAHFVRLPSHSIPHCRSINVYTINYVPTGALTKDVTSPSLRYVMLNPLIQPLSRSVCYVQFIISKFLYLS